MFMHPINHLELLDREREHAMKQRALERAAGAGTRQPGLARGGITRFGRFLQRAAAGIRPGTAGRPSLTGSSGI